MRFPIPSCMFTPFPITSDTLGSTYILPNCVQGISTCRDVERGISTRPCSLLLFYFQMQRLYRAASQPPLWPHSVVHSGQSVPLCLLQLLPDLRPAGPDSAFCLFIVHLGTFVCSLEHLPVDLLSIWHLCIWAWAFEHLSIWAFEQSAFDMWRLGIWHLSNWRLAFEKLTYNWQLAFGQLGFEQPCI